MSCTPASGGCVGCPNAASSALPYNNIFLQTSVVILSAGLYQVTNESGDSTEVPNKWFTPHPPHGVQSQCGAACGMSTIEKDSFPQSSATNRLLELSSCLAVIPPRSAASNDAVQLRLGARGSPTYVDTRPLTVSGLNTAFQLHPSTTPYEVGYGMRPLSAVQASLSTPSHRTSLCSM